jgi:hypothetical protein
MSAENGRRTIHLLGDLNRPGDLHFVFSVPQHDLPADPAIQALIAPEFMDLLRREVNREIQIERVRRNLEWLRAEEPIRDDGRGPKIDCSLNLDYTDSEE